MKGPLWQLLVGTRGGPRRIDILLVLDRQPRNAHEIAVLLCMEYKAVRHHLRVLTANGLLVAGEGYGAVYAWSLELEAMRNAVDAAVRAPKPRRASRPDSAGAHAEA